METNSDKLKWLLEKIKQCQNKDKKEHLYKKIEKELDDLFYYNKNNNYKNKQNDNRN